MATTRTSYRMGVPNPETGVRPVNKVVARTDGKTEFVQLEKAVAPTLEVFREMWPTEPVDGAPRGDELQVITADLTDEQLAELGLSRVEQPEPEPEPSLFASEDAERKAYDSGIDMDLLIPGGGSGRNGSYNTQDIRFFIAKAAETRAAEMV